MAKLALLRGIPGSGKTTLAKSSFYDYTNVEADMYFVNPVTNLYEFDHTKLYRAHMWCQDMTRSLLVEGRNVVVSNTFTTMKEMKDYLNMAEDLNVPVRVIKVIGNFQNVHNVPEETLERMRNRWQDYPGEDVVDNTLNS